MDHVLVHHNYNNRNNNIKNKKIIRSVFRTLKHLRKSILQQFLNTAIQSRNELNLLLFDNDFAFNS